MGRRKWFARVGVAAKLAHSYAEPGLPVTFPISLYRRSPGQLLLPRTDSYHTDIPFMIQMLICFRLTLFALLIGACVLSAHAQQSTWPGADRPSLRLPDSLWLDILKQAGHADRPLGYTDQQMRWFGNERHRLRTIALLFGDVRSITRYSGSLAVQLVQAAGDPAAVVRTGFALTDVSAGRFMALPDSATLQLDKRIATLPFAVQRLVARIVAGAADARPWLDRAFASGPLIELLGSGASIDSVYRLVTAPWVEERLGQSATLRRVSLELPSAIDREYLAFASVLFLTHLNRALDEFRAAPATTMPMLASPIVLTTPVGELRISGAGSDLLDRPVALSIDLGGDDVYRGRHAVGFAPAAPIAVVVDLGGNDTYDASASTLGIASGLFGIGVVVDLDGNDSYRCRESGIASAWYGTGVLIDQAGDDRYVVDSLWGQGAAHIGVAALIDHKGNDTYTCAQQSQALGSTLGAGILLDVEGNDEYLARDDGNPSELYHGQSVAMSQGCGYGRRADMGDGHSLAGGFGVLVDGAGDDSYHATAWSQGCGYWWGAGFLEDLGGHDTYRNGKYSLGAAAHFAIGLHSDLSGNDRYNVGNAATINQYQGHARDGSIGISIDGDGNDRYKLLRHCGGVADLASIGLFWDRRGSDTFDLVYAADTTNVGWNNTPPLGGATTYPLSNTFRDDLDAVGVFLDTGGDDLYRWEGAAPEGPPRQNGARWQSHRDPRSWGIGTDVEIYPRDTNAVQR